MTMLSFLGCRRGGDGNSGGHSGDDRGYPHVVYDYDSEQSSDSLPVEPVRSIGHCRHFGIGCIRDHEVRSGFFSVDVDGIHQIVQLTIFNIINRIVHVLLYMPCNSTYIISLFNSCYKCTKYR